MILILLFVTLSKRKPVNLPIQLKHMEFFFCTERKNFVVDRNAAKNVLKIHGYKDLSLWNVITCRLANFFRRFERS